MNTTEIKIGIGLGDIRFGITKEELIKIAGEPTEKDIYNASGEEDGYLTESWHYDEAEFSVSFDEEDNYRLTTISTSSPDCMLNGVHVVGKGMDHIMALLKDEKLDEPEMEDLSDQSIDQKLLCFLASSLNLWFEDDNLTEVQWGVLWSDEDTPSWPK
jgi:hypothetical protein